MTTYIALWALMIYLLGQGYSYWLVFPLTVVAACFLVRIFIFFHDCCHMSFFSSRRANKILGTITGILTFTPFEDWRRSHLQHHASAGSLDRRGVGDVWTMTVQEYRAARLWTRLAYRLYRNPFIMFGLGPAYVFFVTHRFPHKTAGLRERFSVGFTNVAIAGIIVIAVFTIGLKTYLLIQVPVTLVAGLIGVWMFYVQHQFEDVYWSKHEEWDSVRAAMEGSSYYKLPKVLQWITGNIGLHHIHHLHARIPNYHLQKCCNHVAELREVEPLTLRTAFKSLWIHLWDENQRRLISFRAMSKQS
jgi:omega-6 fatty acid desaturase (delta-12 desaturase)